jgi:hypothetical protein
MSTNLYRLNHLQLGRRGIILKFIRDALYQIWDWLGRNGISKNAQLVAKIDMRELLRSSPQTTWSRRILRSRACLQTAPCLSSHLNFLKR